MAGSRKRERKRRGGSVQNAAVDTTGTVAKVTGGVIGAAVIGLAKGLTKAVVRSVKR